MIYSTQNRATIGKVLALGLLLAVLLAMALSSTPAGAAVTSSKAYAWGDNYFGQLGNDASGTGTNIPGAVHNLSGVKGVKAGCAHGIALIDRPDQNGFVRAWGDNTYGQLGNGNTGADTGSDVPVAVQNLTNVRNLDGGYLFTLAATQ